MKRGKLIVIEGSDGSGKATQTKLLIKRLKKKGKKVATIEFPQYYKSFFGKLVGRYLHGEFGGVNQVNPYLASILYAGDRLDAKKKMEKLLAKGRITVADRYSPSNLAHQAAKFKTEREKKKYIRWVENLEYKENKIPKPDLVLYLYVPVEISQKLIKGKKKDIHEKNVKYLKKVEKIYLELTRKRKNWVKVKCVEKGEILSREKIHDLVWKIVKKYV